MVAIGARDARRRAHLLSIGGVDWPIGPAGFGINFPVTNGFWRSYSGIVEQRLQTYLLLASLIKSRHKRWEGVAIGRLGCLHGERRDRNIKDSVPHGSAGSGEIRLDSH